MIQISTLLIDDNWQTLGPTALGFENQWHRGFADFKPCDGFPNGLDGLVRKVKEAYPQIKDVGVWHALLGYWGGIASKGWIADNYNTTDIEGKVYYATLATTKSISAQDLPRFYDDYYAYLGQLGVSFVKTDVHCLLAEIKDSPQRAALIPAYQKAWTLAHQRHFNGKAIGCMSLIPEVVWRILLQDQALPVLLRNSDDYFPEIPASHPWHLWANAHTALFTQHLHASALAWDMFQTSHPLGPSHAAARCLSGGPVTITDVPGNYDLDLVKQLVATTPDGRCIALRTSSGRSKRAFDQYRETNILRIITKAPTRATLLGPIRCWGHGDTASCACI